MSTALSVDEGYEQYRSDDEDVTAAALAAVASSRRSPNNGSAKKGRQPLPREFMERKNSDEKVCLFKNGVELMANQTSFLS